MNNKDVCAIEVIYKANTKRNKRMFKLSSTGALLFLYLAHKSVKT